MQLNPLNSLFSYLWTDGPCYGAVVKIRGTAVHHESDVPCPRRQPHGPKMLERAEESLFHPCCLVGQLLLASSSRWSSSRDKLQPRTQRTEQRTGVRDRAGRHRCGQVRILVEGGWLGPGSWGSDHEEEQTNKEQDTTLKIQRTPQHTVIPRVGLQQGCADPGEISDTLSGTFI